MKEAFSGLLDAVGDPNAPAPPRYVILSDPTLQGLQEQVAKYVDLGYVPGTMVQVVDKGTFFTVPVVLTVEQEQRMATQAASLAHMQTMVEHQKLTLKQQEQVLKQQEQSIGMTAESLNLAERSDQRLTKMTKVMAAAENDPLGLGISAPDEVKISIADFIEIEKTLANQTTRSSYDLLTKIRKIIEMGL